MKLLYSKLLTLICLSQLMSPAFAAPKVISVNVGHPEIKEVYNVYNAVGAVKTAQRKDFTANVSGRIDFITTKQGSSVKQGEVLLIIEKDLAENTKTQAENSLKEASLLLNRNNILYKQKVISLQDLENSKLQLDIAKLDLEKANNLYKNMVLVAPFDGIMGGVSYVEGEYINSVSQSPELLFSIIDPSSKQFIIFYLPEILMDKIAQGSDVNVFYKDKVYKCKVVTKSNYISKTNGGFFVKLELDDNKLPDGAYVMAEFVFNKHMALTVPEYALMKKANGNMVYVVNDDKAKAVNVNIGSRLAGNVEILSDQINQDSNVVMQGLVKLSDGAIVKVEQNKVN